MESSVCSVSFETLGGSQVVKLQRAQPALAPTVLILPALGLRAEYYAPLVTELVRRGLSAGAVDLPGHGVSPIRARRGSSWGYAELVAHAAEARRSVAEALEGAPVFWLGHSIGGQVALLESGADPSGARGVALVASGSPYFRAFSGAAAGRVALGTASASLLARVFGYFPGDRARFAGREASRLIQQWAYVARTGSYTFSDLDGEGLLRQGRSPVLAIRIEGDDWAPKAAIEHPLGKLGPRRIERRTWRGLPPPNIHNRWPRTPDAAAGYVHDFVHSVLAESIPATAATTAATARLDATSVAREGV